jgi:hypothetical protein
MACNTDDEEDDDENSEDQSGTTKVTTKVCEQADLGYTMDIPESWTCTPTTQGEFYSLEVSSDLFTILSSNAGRGPYCGEAQEDEIECDITDFYTNEVISLSLYTENGVDGEILGGFVDPIITNAGGVWISISYDDIKTRKLTETEKAELETVLDSIEKM